MNESFALVWRIVEIIWINLLLSGDNAILIALACRGLVAEQRRWGVFLGVLGGLALRVVLTLGIAQVMSVPLLKVVGGLLLLVVAIKLLDDEANDSHIAAKNDLRSAIVAIIAADIVMSLDNVIAIAAAAHGSMFLIIFGLALSAPIVIFGAGFLLRLLERFPPLVWAGAGLLGWVAGEMIADDPSSELLGLLDHEKLQIGLPVLGCALVLIVSFAVETARLRRERG